MVARAVGLVAGTKAVGPTPSAGAATRGEVPARPDRAHTEVTSGVGWADMARVRALAELHTFSPPQKLSPSPPSHPRSGRKLGEASICKDRNCRPLQEVGAAGSSRHRSA
jgi:hypothetical protein